METNLVAIRKEINKTFSKSLNPADLCQVADYLVDLKKLKEMVQEYYTTKKANIVKELKAIEEEEAGLIEKIENEEGKWRGIVNNTITKAIQDGTIVDKTYQGEKGKITMVADVEIEIEDIKALVNSIVNNAYGDNGWKFIDAKKGEIKKFIKATGFSIDGVKAKNTAYMKLTEK